MDLRYFYDSEKLTANQKTIKKIFFYRICGTGMGAVACLLKEAGLEVSGGDTAFYPPMSTYLEASGIQCYDLKELGSNFLKEFDLIVVGNSLSGKSDEARSIEALGVPFASFPDVLGSFILKDKIVIGVAGTHGKTTTTYFMEQLLSSLGEDCGYLIGGLLEGRPPAKIGSSPYFVIESDEYDSAYFQKIAKFRLFKLNHMILTSLEFDHADIYDSVEDIKDEFRESLNSFEGHIVFDSSYPASIELQKEYPNFKWHAYESSKIENYKNLEAHGVSFCIQHPTRLELIDLETNIMGRHNILNINACVSMLLLLGFELQKIKEALLNLKLVKRRQELRGMYKGAYVIDDFAHHPRAVELTIKAIKDRYANSEIITVFEPISATARSSIFQKEFTQALSFSDKVVVAANPLKTTVKNSENLNANQMAQELQKKGIESKNVTTLSDLTKAIDQFTSEGAVLLVLSNRTCLGLWESNFVSLLK